MEIIERYVYAVVKHIPEKGREEVEKEVKMLIYDMMEEYSEDIKEEEKARRVIEKLGDPEKLARKYMGKERYLIGPKNFTKYLFVLKIVLLSVFLGVSIASLFGAITTELSIIDSITNYIAIVFEALLQGAAWVTVIFAIIEYKNVDFKNEMNWSIKELPQIPNKKALISRGESIFTIIFATIFFSILYFVPQLIGVYYKSNGSVVNIPVFNIDVLNNYKIIIILVFVVLIVQESIKILWGRWTVKRAIVSSVISVISSILTIVFFTNKEIWNMKISDTLYQFTGFELISLTNLIVIIIIFATLLEIGTTLYKGIKYGK